MRSDTVLRHPAIALLAALGALSTAAAPAAAVPVLDPLKLCYVSIRTAPKTFETETVRVGGSGFTPHALVDVSVDGTVAAAGVPVDATGVLAPGAVKAPAVRRGQRAFTITATERDDASQTVSLQANVTELAVRVRPRRARPAQRVRFRGRGFTDRGGIYAHYLRRGRLRRTVRLARAASGPCGTFSVRRRQFPFRPRQGTWRVQIDQHRRLTDDGPLVTLSIDVRRRPRRA